MKHLAILLAALCSSARALPEPASPELPITVEGLQLSFMTPDGWRLLAESSPEELVLAPGKSKTKPILRIRAFGGRLSAKDRLADMTRGLVGEEQLVSFVSAEKWTLEARTFETATALYKKGSQEWYARFTLVDQPNKLQHGFWIFGRKQDIERHWKVVQASIRSSVHGAAEPSVGTKPEQGASTQAGGVWRDQASGLRIAGWPTGYAPDEASLSRLATSGVVMTPSDPSAPPGTQLHLTRRSVGESLSAESLADSLEERLGQAAGVDELQRLKLRVAGQPAVSLRWSQELDGESFSFEVWLWKHEGSLYRLDASATSAWAGARKRHDLVKQFASGLSLP